MKTKQELQKELDEKLDRLNALKRQRPKRHCGHKEYSSADDVTAAMEIEALDAKVSELQSRIAGRQ